MKRITRAWVWNYRMEGPKTFLILHRSTGSDTITANWKTYVKQTDVDFKHNSIIGGSLATMAWHILRFWVMASR
jgi:hypothetical protein